MRNQSLMKRRTVQKKETYKLMIKSKGYLTFHINDIKGKIPLTFHINDIKSKGYLTFYIIDMKMT